MKLPTPSDFTVEAKEAHVSVIFKPSDSHYNFGRLADPEDIARYGPLSRSSNVRHGKTGDTGEYPGLRDQAVVQRTRPIRGVCNHLQEFSANGGMRGGRCSPLRTSLHPC
jgi:hypothetical protein